MYAKKLTLTVRLSPHEMQKIDLQAKAAKMKKSDFVRLLLSGPASIGGQAPAAADPAVLDEVRAALLALADEVRKSQRIPYPAEWAIRRVAEGAWPALDPFHQRIAGAVEWCEIFNRRWPTPDDPGVFVPPDARPRWPASLEAARAAVAAKLRN